MKEKDTVRTRDMFLCVCVTPSCFCSWLFFTENYSAAGSGSKRQCRSYFYKSLQTCFFPIERLNHCNLLWLCIRGLWIALLNTLRTAEITLSYDHQCIPCYLMILGLLDLTRGPMSWSDQGLATHKSLFQKLLRALFQIRRLKQEIKAKPPPPPNSAYGLNEVITEPWSIHLQYPCRDTHDVFWSCSRIETRSMYSC